MTDKVKKGRVRRLINYILGLFSRRKSTLSTSLSVPAEASSQDTDDNSSQESEVHQGSSVSSSSGHVSNPGPKQFLPPTASVKSPTPVQPTKSEAKQSVRDTQRKLARQYVADATKKATDGPRMVSQAHTQTSALHVLFNTMLDDVAFWAGNDGKDVNQNTVFNPDFNVNQSFATVVFTPQALKINELKNKKISSSGFHNGPYWCTAAGWFRTDEKNAVKYQKLDKDSGKKVILNMFDTPSEKLHYFFRCYYVHLITSQGLGVTRVQDDPATKLLFEKISKLPDNYIKYAFLKTMLEVFEYVASPKSEAVNSKSSAMLPVFAKEARHGSNQSEKSRIASNVTANDLAKSKNLAAQVVLLLRAELAKTEQKIKLSRSSSRRR